MQELVSIIIPTFNREHVISDTLDSIINQSYKNWECIVVDDGSIDKTIDIVSAYQEKDKRIKLHTRPKVRRKGGNSCRNYGYELSQGMYIQWFDSDDLMHQDKIMQKATLLETQRNYDFVVCEGVEFIGNDKNNTSTKWNKIEAKNPLIAHITGDISFHTNGPLFRKSFIKDKLLFNETLLRKQEWEFYSRLLMQSQNYYPLHKELYYFRVHDNSINSNNSKKTLSSRIRANNLVFKNLKKHKETLDEHTYLRKHFLNKYIYFFKLMLSLKQYKSFIYIVRGLLIISNRKIIWSSFKNFIKNPRILLNLFNLGSKTKKIN
ncbi:MAG: glycosyltransferase family 2 protein [Flavobacteriaceae bacterium]